MIIQKLTHFLLAFGIFLPQWLYSQCIDHNMAYKTGEKVSYTVYYNLGFIWLDAGFVTFSVNNGLCNRRPVYHITSIGQTHPGYDWIYKVRDYYETKIDTATLLPLYFLRNVSEGNYKASEVYEFDYEKSIVRTFVSNSEKPHREGNIKMVQCLYDVLSGIYYARNLKFENKKPGDKIPIKLILDNEIYASDITCLGTEIIIIPGNLQFNCIKFKIQLIEGSIFSGGEEMTVWVSNDENRIPVLVEANILVGSIKAVITSAENTRYSFEWKKADK